MAGGGYRTPHSEVIPYCCAAVALAVALFASFCGFRNYCLLDPLEHRLYRVFQFLWWRQRQIVFSEGQALALTAEGRSRYSRGGLRWYYRMVAFGADGCKEPLSNWQQDGLENWNLKARQLAPLLGCEFREAPPHSVATVVDDNGTASLVFSRSFWPQIMYLGMTIAVVVVALIVGWLAANAMR